MGLQVTLVVRVQDTLAVPVLYLDTQAVWVWAILAQQQLEAEHPHQLVINLIQVLVIFHYLVELQLKDLAVQLMVILDIILH
jgi:hypothetical protein